MYGTLTEQSAVDRLAAKLPAQRYEGGETVVHDSLIEEVVVEVQHLRIENTALHRIAELVDDIAEDVGAAVSRGTFGTGIIVGAVGAVFGMLVGNWLF